KLLVGDSTLMMQAPVVSLDSVVKATPVLIDSARTPPKPVKVAPAKVVKPELAKSNLTKPISKKKVQVKGGKSKPKLNNKPKNNSLNKKTKTAKAIMPKKSKSPTKNN
ncbi:MAG: hypothetical protein ACK5DH_01290, partial [Chitinophagia bacterium]